MASAAALRLARDSNSSSRRMVIWDRRFRTATMSSAVGTVAWKNEKHLKRDALLWQIYDVILA